MNRSLAMLAGNPRLFFHRALTRLKSSLCPRTASGRITGKRRGVLFEYDFELNYRDMIREMYTGRYEIDVQVEMARHLRPGDTFLDVGANIGFISACAAGLVGKTGSVHAFEPVSCYFERLKKLEELNPDHCFHLNRMALGSRKEQRKIFMHSSGNIGANSLVEDESKQEGETVSVGTFDSYCREKGLDSLKMVKLDCEGFEFEVLKGMKDFLDSVEVKPVIIAELSPSVYEKLGYSAASIINFLKEYGYRPFDIKTGSRLKPSVLDSVRDRDDVINTVFRTGKKSG